MRNFGEDQIPQNRSNISNPNFMRELTVKTKSKSNEPNISTIKNQMQASFSQLFQNTNQPHQTSPLSEIQESPQFTLGIRNIERDFDPPAKCRSNLDNYILMNDDRLQTLQLKKLNSQLQHQNQSMKEENIVLKAFLQQVCKEYSLLQQQMNIQPKRLEQKQENQSSIYQKILNSKHQQIIPKQCEQGRLRTLQNFQNSMNLSQHYRMSSNEQLKKQLNVSLIVKQKKQNLCIDIEDSK